MIAAIIQARLGAERLPGKVLMKLGQSNMLDFQLKRIKKSKRLNEIIVATTEEKQDDKIVEFCEENRIKFYRGSTKDVLSRYYHCAKLFKVDTIVRLTADCPFIDPSIIDKVIDIFFEERADFSSNTVPPETSSWPDGSDVEVFSFKNLEIAYKNSVDLNEREHVTFYFWKNKTNNFSNVQLDNDQDWSKYRFTLDYPKDFEVIKKIYFELKKNNQFGYVKDVVDILKNNPEIRNLNKDYHFGIGWDNK